MNAKSIKWISILLVGFCFVFAFIASKMDMLSSSGVLIINRGDSLTSIADKLYIKNDNNRLFFILYTKIWLRLTNSCNGGLKAGEYEFNNNEKIASFLQKVCDNKVLMHSITIPEGFETREIVEILNTSELLTGDKINTAPEGSLLPETYYFPRGMSRIAMSQQMTKAMQEALDEAWLNRHQNLPLKDKNELLILASIVEKEARKITEREIIASVYLNRLKTNMRLQADPTVVYEITKGGCKLERQLTLKDLMKKGEYNTYRMKGLPKYPIANPGRATIFATAKPVETDYLFFVANGVDGGHIFSKTYQEHTENIKLYRANLSIDNK